MSKAILISIQPKWCSLIANGKKTLEIRKTRPKLEAPFKCYIYCTLGKPKDSHKLLEIHGSDGKIRKANGMVIGEFVCDKITCLGNVATDQWKCLLGSTHEYLKRIVTRNACLTEDELLAYRGKYGWHISDLVIYDRPQELNRFVVEGDCDCMNCRKCSWFNRGNGYNVEDDCDLGYENIYRKKSLKPLFRPPQSWCYVEDLDGGADHEA